VPRWTHTVGTTTAAVALAGLAVFGGAATASADPTPGYPGGYPGGYTGGGTPGGIDTTNPNPGGPVTVTASCGTGAGATLTFDGQQIGTAPVSGGTAVITGTIPAGTSGSHTVVATCDSGQTYTFAVTVGGTGGDPSGALASTGAKVATIAGGGVALLIVGFGLVFLARRRNNGITA
jgi:LPXTG-motif cell wall-anchored protein